MGEKIFELLNLALKSFAFGMLAAAAVFLIGELIHRWKEWRKKHERD